MVYIGTSGWNYGDWKEKFYKNAPSKDWLKLYSKHFKTVEINYSFYRLPKKSDFKKWHGQTPDNFIFSVKASRFITHIKRLKGVARPWKQFFSRAKKLKKKLGPILLQFPENFSAEGGSSSGGQANINRLEKFLKSVASHTSSKLQVAKQKIALEFRHKSWFDKRIYEILRKYNVALVVADSSKYPKSLVVTADFVYIRFHGPAALFCSKYSNKELKKWAKKISAWGGSASGGKDIYIYFNNDSLGYAVENARALASLLK